MTTIAVVIPFFQREAGILQRALRSIADQRFEEAVEVDVVVVDDGSPIDPSAEVAALALPSNVSVRIVTRANGGPGNARNTGLDHLLPATCAVAFLDSDDSWLPDHLQKGLNALAHGAELYFCDNQPWQHGCSYFEELSRLSEGELDVRRLLGAEATLAIGTSPASYLVMPGASALQWMSRLYLAHTSTLIISKTLASSVRFEGSLRRAGEDYLFVLRAAGSAAMVAFCSEVGVLRGRGIDLYMSATGWGHPENLSQILDNLRCFLYAKDDVVCRAGLVGIEERVQAYRTELIYAWFGEVIRRRRFAWGVAYRALCYDHGLFVRIPMLLCIALSLRMTGRKAIDHLSSPRRFSRLVLAESSKR